jgi:cyclic pyranopterin phosphate synthase
LATDLRLSLTDRCNLRCTYCMPPEGLDWLPSAEVLTDDEVVRLVTIAIERLGIREVRLTGGEPLIRPGLPGIIRRLAEIQPRPGLSMTTNGVGLERTAGALADAGLNRVNVSLDTLDEDRFARITHRNRFTDTIAGLRAAAEAGMKPVKLNAVLLRGVNDDEAVPLVEFALENGYELRFIEQMPLDPHGAWDRSEMVTAAEILDVLSARYLLTPDPQARGGAPAERWLIDAGPAKVGVIGSVTRPFCGACDRTRLTADGQVRSCLFAREEADLCTPLRSGASDSELATRWRVAMWGKKAGHGIDDPAFVQPARSMSAIGG